MGRNVCGRFMKDIHAKAPIVVWRSCLFKMSPDMTLRWSMFVSSGSIGFHRLSSIAKPPRRQHLHRPLEWTP